MSSLFLSLCLMLTKSDVYVQGHSYQIAQSVNRASCVNQLIFNAGMQVVIELVPKISSPFLKL